MTPHILDATAVVLGIVDSVLFLMLLAAVVITYLRDRKRPK